jgi:uncharacterized protein YqeY
MTIQEQIQQDIKTAMRGGEKLRVEVLRMAMASLKNAQIAQVKAAYDTAAAESGDQATVDRTVALSEEAAQDTLAREVKRRREAADAYRQAKREDLAAQEEAEATILEAYLPKQLTPDELRPQVVAAINELGVSGPSDMGKVMPVLMQRFKGRADGRVLSQLVREVLSQR